MKKIIVICMLLIFLGCEKETVAPEANVFYDNDMVSIYVEPKYAYITLVYYIINVTPSSTYTTYLSVHDHHDVFGLGTYKKIDNDIGLLKYSASGSIYEIELKFKSKNRGNYLARIDGNTYEYGTFKIEYSKF